MTSMKNQSLEISVRILLAWCFFKRRWFERSESKDVIFRKLIYERLIYLLLGKMRYSIVQYLSIQKSSWAWHIDDWKILKVMLTENTTAEIYVHLEIQFLWTEHTTVRSLAQLLGILHEATLEFWSIVSLDSTCSKYWV